MPPLVQESADVGDKLPREFVKWCCSFGGDFRNSPDVGNLQSWTAIVKVKIQDDDREDFLAEARKHFMKRIEQLVRKADAPPELSVA